MKKSGLFALLILVVVLPLFLCIGNFTDRASKEICDHQNLQNVMVESSSEEHIYNTTCKDCGKVLNKDRAGDHTWNEAGVCTLCQYTCEHTEKTNSYVFNGNFVEHDNEQQCKNCLVKFTVVENHVWVNGDECALCKFVCRHAYIAASFGGYLFIRDSNGNLECCYCNTYFDYVSVDDNVILTWLDGDRFTWFYFDWRYDFTVDGEVVDKQSGLVVCHEDGTSVGRDEIVKSGGSYKLTEKEHGEIISVDENECEHTFTCVDEINSVVKCTACGFKVKE